MPYDPALPADGSDLVSAEMRAQLSGLKDLIDAITTITAAQIDSVSTGNPGDPANVGLSVAANVLHFTFSLPRGDTGPAGPQGNHGMDGSPGAPGAQGPPFAAAVVDGVTTLNPGESATVGVSFDGSNVRFTFGIPRGADGAPGNNGADGAPGPQGPPFAAAVVDGVTTLNPGESATVGVSFDGSNVRFTFGIPRGADGAPGNNGADGAPGPQGPPGEVSNATLATAIAGTSSNSNAVATLGQTADANYQPAQIQDLINKVDELIGALRR
jgi:hypothetical protein